MRDYNQNRQAGRGDRGGGRFDGGSSNRRSFGDRGSDREMFPAVCDNCGKDCEVPFRPSGNKPVLCSNCFRNKEEGGGGSRIEFRSYDNRNSDNRSSSRDRESSSNSNSNSKNYAELKKQVDAINSKLDKLIETLAPKSTAEPIVESKPKKATKKKVVKKKTEADPVAE